MEQKHANGPHSPPPYIQPVLGFLMCTTSTTTSIKLDPSWRFTLRILKEKINSSSLPLHHLRHKMVQYLEIIRARFSTSLHLEEYLNVKHIIIRQHYFTVWVSKKILSEHSLLQNWLIYTKNFIIWLQKRRQDLKIKNYTFLNGNSDVIDRKSNGTNRNIIFVIRGW